MRIAFLGKAGAGKSTAAKYLVEQWGFVRIGLADPLKEAARELGWNGEKDDAGRRLLQSLGDTARAQDPDCLIKIFRREIARLKPSAHIVVDDLRLRNEVDALREDGFTITLLKGRGGWLGACSEHVTEQIEKLDHDHILWNGDGIPMMMIMLDGLISRIGQGRKAA